MIKLSNTQLKYRNIFLEKLAKGVYKERKINCPCEASDDVEVFSQDKFGIPLRVVICKKCGIMRCDPYYTDKTLENFYDLEYRGFYEEDRDNLKDLFDKQIKTGLFFSNYLQKYYFKGEIKNKTIYEIGCSTGGVLYYFHKLGNNISGCDYDSRHIKFGAKKGLSLYHGGISNLVKIGMKADIVILSHVLEHFGNPVLELNKIRKLLKKKGILFVAVPGIYSIHRSSKGVLKQYIQNAHAFYYTKKSLAYLLNYCGYQMIYGDESIFGLFSKGRVSEELVGENYRYIIKYLNKIKIFGRLYYYLFTVYAEVLYFMRKLGILNPTVKVYRRLFNRF
jgi:SAM-dependent methyltransferase